MKEYLICAILASIVSFIGGIFWERAYTREVEIKLRKTKRALWLARAEKNRLWAIIVDKNPADKVVCFFKRKKRTAMEWYTMLKDNERKCRKKAKEYKEGM